MKVLFISSGNSKWGISPIVKAQGESLRAQGIQLEYVTIVGKRFIGYLRNLRMIKSRIREYNPDLIHAHYSFSAIITSFVCFKPMVVSLMGSDTVIPWFLKRIIQFFAFFRWNAVIVKSANIKRNVKIDNAYILPNGVDVDFWQPIKKNIAQKYTGLDGKIQHILFMANPSRYSKNVELAESAFNLLKGNTSRLDIIFDIKHDEVLYFLNSADVLLLTSRYEGSPNIIKEAMACNCPIVATNVGDISNICSSVAGCYITSFDPIDVAEKLLLALDFAKRQGRTQGRDRIFQLGLDSKTIAKKLIAIYSNI